MRGTERGRFSPMTLFAWLAIGVSVGTMCSLLSVMYGLETSLRDSVLRAHPHIVVGPQGGTQAISKFEPWTDKFKQVPGVERVVPFVETEMIVQSQARTLGAVIWGLPESELESFRGGLQGGDIPKSTSKIAQVLVGFELAHHLGIEAGDEIKIVSPFKRTGALGSIPLTQNFEVAGTYASGHYEFDKQHLFMLLADGQDLTGWRDAISGWHVWTKNPDRADKVQRQISALLTDTKWEAQSWQTFNSALFHSLKLEQYAMFLILSFAVVIAVMNVAITLLMHVTHKKKNVGILRAIGASAEQIRKVFIVQGMFLGIVGMVLGAVLCTIILYYVKHSYEFPDIYYVRTVPIEIRPASILTVYLVAGILVFAATLYPALRAAKLDPIEAIRE